MRHFGRYVVIAMLAVIGEVVVSIDANSVRIPGKYNLVPIGAFVVLVAVTAALDFYQNGRHPQDRPAAILATPAPGDGIALRGRRKKYKYDLGTSVKTMLLCFSIFILAGISLNSFGHSSSLFHHNTTTGITDGLISLFLLILLIRIIIGSPVILEISRGGVTVRDGREHFSIHRRDARKVYTEGSLGESWLVAELPPNSPLVFLPPTSKLYDQRKRLLKLCDLTQSGIKRHEVDGALNYFINNPK